MARVAARTHELFAAATARGAASRWDVRVEIRDGEDARTLELGTRAVSRGPSLVVDVDEAAFEALLLEDTNAFWAKARVRGRFSHFAVVSGALFTHLSAGKKGENAFEGAATTRDAAASPAQRREIANDVLGELRQRFAVRVVARMEPLLRMWTDEEDFTYEPDRLTDYVVPGTVQRAWFDDEHTLAPVCLPRVEALRAEAMAFVTGTEIAPDYYDATKVDGVQWGRVLLVAWDRPVPGDVHRRFPETMRCLDAASATGRLMNACFLTMAPGHALLPHSDGNACFASWHLGLVVPEGCAVEAGGEPRAHADGRWIAFDDSYAHAAWNRSAKPRVVLTGWTIHPDLDDDEACALAHVARRLGWGT